MFYQCHVLTDGLGTWRRQHGRRGDAWYPVQSGLDHLLIVSVGGVPLATAGVQDLANGDGWYISAICSGTRTGGGSLAITPPCAPRCGRVCSMRYLQSRQKLITADAVGDALGFYRRHGFVPEGENLPLCMRWRRPKRKASRDPRG
jgi:hypothetical protein